MSTAFTWVIKNWRITLVAGLIFAVAFMYWRMEVMSARLDMASQKTAQLEKTVSDQAADIKNANNTLSARAKENSTMMGELFNMRRDLSQVMKNDEIANAWRGNALPDSILEWMREQSKPATN